ncbi:helix-turn-helix transcriptional regulator [Lentzea tibetensis]|nr:LuxR family transcriptional regulator [Lentzea tibetensis]
MSGRPNLVERDGQWAVLESLRVKCAAGNGQVALISGPVASGKTELLHEFARHAVDDGFVLLKANCSRAEQSLPFGVVRQLYRGLRVPAALRRFARVLEAAMEPDGEALVRELHALCAALLDVVGDRPVLLGVDDVRNADLLSAQWLEYVIRRCGSEKLMVVLTETSAPKLAHSPLHTELLRHPHCHRVDVAPLRGLSPELHAVSGGNPLLVKAFEEDGDCVGSNFRRALVSCLHRCAPDVLPVARALAVLGKRSAVARLARVDEEVVDVAVRTMSEAGLLADGAFRDPAARTAVLDDMSTQDRKELHLAAALLLHDEGAPATEVAPLLVLADHSEHPWMIPVFEDAAEEALREEQVETAARYLTIAQRVSADPRVRGSTSVKLVRVETRLNPAAAARRLPALVADMRLGHLADRDVAGMIGPLLWHGHTADAIEALDRVRHTATVEVDALDTWLYCVHPALADRDRPRHEPSTNPPLRAVTALASVLGNGPTGQAVTLAEQVLHTARISDSCTWAVDSAVAALHVLVYSDRLDLAQTWSTRLLADAMSRGTETAQALYAAVRGEAALRRGELTVAFEHAQLSLTVMPRGGWGIGVGFPLGTAIAAATRMGNHDEAARLLEQRVPDGVFRSRYGLHYTYARGLHYLAVNRHYAAMDDFLLCGEQMTDWGVDAPGLVPWRTATAEAWIGQGCNREEASRLIHEQLSLLGPDASRTRGAALRLLAAISPASGRPPVLAEAVAVLEECDDQYELARALADLSRAHQELREHRRAWTVARRAWRVANACDALPLCEELSPSGGADADFEASGPIASLTDAERRVAALASVGYTNREIAGKLFITPSTIEQHLTRVYRKLNVRYRKDLPPELQAYLPSTA